MTASNLPNIIQYFKSLKPDKFITKHLVDFGWHMTIKILREKIFPTTTRWQCRTRTHHMFPTIIIIFSPFDEDLFHKVPLTALQGTGFEYAKKCQLPFKYKIYYAKTSLNNKMAVLAWCDFEKDSL